MIELEQAREGRHCRPGSTVARVPNRQKEELAYALWSRKDCGFWEWLWEVGPTRSGAAGPRHEDTRAVAS